MWRKYLLTLPVVAAAFLILFISVFRTAAVKYDFSKIQSQNGKKVLGDNDTKIQYRLANPGSVLPDHPLWPVKAARDRIWLYATTSDTRKAELNLLLADKRLFSAKILFEKSDIETGYTALTKAEKYLEEAAQLEQENRKHGIDTSEFLIHLANASLKHLEVINDMLLIVPEEVRPPLIEIQKYSASAYEQSRNALLETGLEPPENPFNRP